MVWTAGAIGVFEPVEGLEDKLRDFSYTRKAHHLTTGKPFHLKSVIHLDSPQVELSGKSRLLSGIVHSEYIYSPQKLAEDKHGVYQLVDGEPQVDVTYGKFWLTTKAVVNIVVAERAKTREFTFNVLSQAIAKNNNHCQPITMDVNRIARDYDKHWISGMHERHGMLQAGRFYGDSLEREPLLRSEYKGWNKNQVGFVTDYFGSPTKVRVTNGGTVMVLRDLSNQMQEFIN